MRVTGLLGLLALSIAILGDGSGDGGPHGEPDYTMANHCSEKQIAAYHELHGSP